MPQFIASLAVFAQVAPQQLPEEHAVPFGAVVDPQTCAVHVAMRQSPGGWQSAAVEQPPELELLLDALVVGELTLALDVVVVDEPLPPVLDVVVVEAPPLEVALPVSLDDEAPVLDVEPPATLVSWSV